MQGEAVAQICASLATEVRAARASDGFATPFMDEAIRLALTAPSMSVLDALALAALARRLLGLSMEQLEPEALAEPDQEQVCMIYAAAFLDRAVQTLELQTGYSADGFTGEAESVN